MLKSTSLLKLVFISTITFSAQLQAALPDSRGSILDTQGNPTMLTPIGGFIKKIADAGEGVGKKGLQKYHDVALASGTDVQTSIHGPLQKHIERMLDKSKIIDDAKEVLAMVMDSKTGEILVMATSNRYDPLCIRQKDIPSLNPKFAEYPYEPGGVIKPFVIASAVNADRHYVKKWFNTDYDKFKIGDNTWISDHHRQVTQQPIDVLVNSSNIGISQIAWDISATDFHSALTRFGFGVKSGIDLPRDLEGTLKPVRLLEKKMYRASTAYGYGMMATPIQLLKAYSAFANDGWMVTPHIGKKDEVEKSEVLSKPAARQMKNMLIEVVKRGTGEKAQVAGLTIGGKTGTAHMAELGKYVQKYHGSFYGFAEDDKGHSYTIGILVIEAKAPEAYFASRSAVPVFRNIVEEMLEQKLLSSSEEKMDIKKMQKQESLMHNTNQKLNIVKKKVGLHMGEKP